MLRTRVITGCATGFVNGRWQFSTPTESTPITKKLVQVITSAAPNDGGFWANGWNITKFFFYLYLFFMNSPTGQTRRRIFTLDGSNDADSRKDVPFGGFVDTAPHFGGEIPRKPQFSGAWIGVFKPNGQNIESFMLSKLLHRFQPNFAQR